MILNINCLVGMWVILKFVTAKLKPHVTALNAGDIFVHIKIEYTALFTVWLETNIKKWQTFNRSAGIDKTTQWR